MPDLSPHIYTTYIIVFRGDPLDLQQYRHTALLFVPLADDGDDGEGDDGGDDGEGDEVDTTADTYYCNAIGFRGEFTFQDSTNYAPQREEDFAAQLRVGRTTRPVMRLWLAALLQSVPVRNDDNEFNCQTWVQLALERLSQDGYLARDEYEQGVTDMVVETLKAVDEPPPFAVW